MKHVYRFKQYESEKFTPEKEELRSVSTVGDKHSSEHNEGQGLNTTSYTLRIKVLANLQRLLE